MREKERPQEPNPPPFSVIFAALKTTVDGFLLSYAADARCSFIYLFIYYLYEKSDKY